MTTHATTFDAFRLARKREVLRGEAAMTQLPRLAQAVLDPHARLRYEIQGQVDAGGHPGALMRLSGRLPLRCERCNEALNFELEREVAFRFVRSEEELNALPIEDNELEEVVGSPSMALLPWIEDEAILSLPLVPRHENCALPLDEEPEPMDSGRPSPFAVLGKLKRGDGGGAAGG
jgi:uncharacterized protein